MPTKTRTTIERVLKAGAAAAILAVAGAAGYAPAQRRDAAVAAPWPGDRFDVMEKSIPELQAAMTAGIVTAGDLVEIYLARIAAYDQAGPRLNAMIALNPRARGEAAALDRERAARGPRGPLHGVPLVIKDNFDLAGMPTTAGSLALAGLRPPDDAFQVRKLREAGAVILGKTNMHELASGITTISSLGGQTRNPYDLARNPGGSSGGTGAAVAANFAAAGMGSDTCGSIRIPASHNALVGLRGSFGLASRDGVVPLSHTQDVAGPIARSVTDVAILLDATVGHDPADETTAAGEGKRPASYRDALAPDALAGARIGVLTSLFGDAAEDGEARGIVRRALEEMKTHGAEAVEVDVPGFDELLRGSGVIDAEFKFDLADYLAGVPGAPVTSLGEILDRGLIHAAVEGSARRRNAVASRETPQYYRARLKRQALAQALTAVMDAQHLDALAYPTMRRKPAVIGEPQGGSTCQMSAASGLPALSLPAGFTRDGLPIGLELIGRAFGEARLLALGYAFEQHARVRRPPFSTPALVGRSAPPPADFQVTVAAAAQARPGGLAARFSFDRTTGELRYEASTSELAADAVLAAWIHRAGENDRGPATYQVLGRAERRRSGVVVLPPAEHAALDQGRFYLALYTRENPTGELRAPLRLPSRRP
jgi:Asp-tRNA(Asn)/Glu-tRNA(Gln) amidotransferase A subunit family amidase